MRVNGLPADSAMRRADTWSRTDELLSLLLERQETWGSVLAGGWGIKPLPDLLTIRHPDRPEDGPKPRETTNDPDKIRQFFAGVGR